MPNPWDVLPDAPKAKKNPWDDLPDAPEADEWSTLNDPTAMAEEQNQRLASMPAKKETSLQQIIRKVKERDAYQRGQSMKQRLGNLTLDPVSAVGKAFNDVRGVMPDSVQEQTPELPAANIASNLGGMAKTYAGVGRRFWNTVAPGSEEAKASGDVVRGIEGELGNYDRSALGEMAGGALATLPLGPSGGGAATGGRLAQIGKQFLTGASMGAIDPQTDVSDEDYSWKPAAIGGAFGVAAGQIPELAGKAAPYLRKPEEFLQSIRNKMGGTQTERVFKGQTNAEKLSRIKASDAEFSNAYEGSEGINPDLSGVKATIESQLKKLKTAVEPDKTLIGRLEGIIDNIDSVSAPKAKLTRYEQLIADAKGAQSGDKPDLSVKGLSEWRRLVGQRQQAAYDTAGNAVTVTPSREAGDAVRAIKGEIDRAIEDASPEVAKKLAAARSNWKTSMEPYIPDNLGQDPLGRVIKTSTPDKELESILSSKSSNEVSNILAGLNPKAKEAMKARILEDAFAAKSGAKLGQKQSSFANSILGADGKLSPAAEQLFSGEERKALMGAAKVAQYAHRAGMATNVVGGVLAAGPAGGSAGTALAGSGGGALGGIGGSLAGGWAARKWIPNITAPLWEKMIRNPGTRSLLVLLGKMPENSPEFQRASASLMTRLAMEEE